MPGIIYSPQLSSFLAIILYYYMRKKQLARKYCEKCFLRIPCCVYIDQFSIFVRTFIITFLMPFKNYWNQFFLIFLKTTFYYFIRWLKRNEMIKYLNSDGQWVYQRLWNACHCKYNLIHLSCDCCFVVGIKIIR